MMRKLTSFVLLTIVSLFMISCDSLWTINNNATVSFTFDATSILDSLNTDSSSNDTLSNEILANADQTSVSYTAVISLWDDDDNILQSQTISVDLDNLIITTQFTDLIPNSDIYATITIEDNNTIIFSAQSKALTLKAGSDNILETKANVVFLNPFAGEGDGEGNDDNVGYLASKPVETMEKALEILADVDNGTIWVMETIIVNDAIKDWVAKDGQSITLKRHRDNDLSLINIGSGGSVTLTNLIIDGQCNINGLGGNYVGDARALIELQGGSAVLNNTVLQNNNNTSVMDGGGAVYLGSTDSTFTMNSGLIQFNNANGSYGGGGIFIAQGSFLMNDGVISNNTAPKGGGVALETGTFTMEKGTISRNSSSGNGGGVYSSNNFTLKGGSITGNSASAGCGVYLNSGSGELNLRGNPNVTGNSKTVDNITQKNNVEFNNATESLINIVETLDADAKIGLTPTTINSTVAYANDSSSFIQDTGVFSFDNGLSYGFSVVDSKLKLGPINAVYVGGENASSNNNGLTPSTPVDTFANAKERLTANTGTIWVLGKLTVTGTDNLWSSEIGETITLKRHSSYNRDIINVGTDSASAILSLENIIIDGNKTEVADSSSLIYVPAGSSLTLETDAVLQNNKAPGADGAAVHVKGTVTMYEGSSIIGNDATGGSGNGNGGAIGVAASGKLVMEGGSITENTGKNVGGVFLETPAATATISGESKIYGNTVSGDASNLVYTNSSTSPITFGSFGDNADVWIKPSNTDIGDTIANVDSGQTVQVSKIHFDDGLTGFLLQDDTVLKIVSELPSIPTQPTINDEFYQIGTVGELMWFRDHVNDGNKSAKAVLTADINLDGEANGSWEPIGLFNPTSEGWGGIFDGASHTVTGLYINTPEGFDSGLFANINESGIVKNLIIKEADVTSKAWSGILAAKVSNNAIISNVGIVGGTITGTDSCTIGALVGVVNENMYTPFAAKITACFSTATLAIPVTNGGLVGEIQNNSSSAASECYYVSDSNYGILEGITKVDTLETLNTHLGTMNDAAVAADPSIGYQWGADGTNPPKLQAR